jgi:hypothetical protein
MKTYKELEREAYMAGNTELSNLYAELDDIQHELDVYDQHMLSREYGGT